MSNTRNNPAARTFKEGITPEDLHDLFLDWLNALLRHARTRAILRRMVEEHELAVIDASTSRATNRVCRGAHGSRDDSTA
jgi:hypothetical protein